MKHAFARLLRRGQTDAERKLWFALRSRQFAGFKFRRQQPIGPYVADFVCFEAKLIIELDGGQHGLDRTVAYDENRSHFLERQGFRVIRFPNHEVHGGFTTVCDAIAHHLRDTPHPPHS